MKTVNSLSGGRTSSYMAVHYPAEIDIFAVVCIDSHNAGCKIDPGIKKAVNERLQKYCGNWPEFVATSEDPKTLKIILDLEQKIGREITWVRGMGWEQMLQVKKALPNMEMRFCTSILKMTPIFWFLYLYSNLPVKMRIGYRYDESDRKEKVTDHFRFPQRTEVRLKPVNRWEEIMWRENEFPLIEDKIFHHTVREFWKNSGFDFPADTNCQNCFWKDPQQLRMNFITNPSIMYWAAIMEDIHQATFRKDYSLLEVNRLGIQMDFNFGTGAGCRAAGCTD